MVSFKEIQFNKKEAVYPQLVAYVKKQILIGSVENNEGIGYPGYKTGSRRCGSNASDQFAEGL